MASSHLRHSALPPLSHPLHPSPSSVLSSSAIRTHSNFDEGFSEGPPDSDMMYTDTNLELLDDNFQDASMRALDLPLHQRKQLAEALIKSLPNADKDDMALLCEHLTHFDPVHFLPKELMLHVLSYVDPKDLLSCSKISRSWRETTQDERLWQACFAREGWVVDTAKMRQAEEDARRTMASSSKQRHLALRRSGSHKRPHGEAFSEGATPRSNSGAVSPIDTSARANVSVDSSGDDMDTTEIVTPDRTPDGSPDRMTMTGGTDMAMNSSFDQREADAIKISPTIFRDVGDLRISWSYLYKQRYRLEKNWQAGRYRMFHLPHQSYPQDGHTECVYTIQHNSDHLVSGSRDKTIRIWNLKTMRLAREPLRGHEASVLCLQFDDRPDQDIIVSGGSDAHVIIWRFSTGQPIKIMKQAHDESVLNLRFDDNYIVTCSKDKTIKLWNRKALGRDDTNLPAHVLNSADLLFDQHDKIREFSLLLTLTGHNAAVNAVMIHEDTIVSASGDRTIRSWDINTGKFKRTYTGHTKGIACVQFDGRRIVSGSSDNTVRIFDAKHAAEVACLSGHDNLVRTVQARFGDLATITNEELADEARKADAAFNNAVSRGMTPATATRRGPRNAGSSRPQDMLAYGARIPPGGGGSKWAKIVSGSYDETVIIWRRARDGKWVPKHRLTQGHHPRSHTHRRPAAPALVPQAAANQTQQQQQPPTQQQVAQAHQLQLAHNGLAQANHVVQGQPPGHTPGLAHSTLAALAIAQQTLGHHLAQQVQQGGSVNPTAQLNMGAAPGAAQQAAVPAAAAAHHHHHHAPRVHSDSNRVFKLEFDARRIVCCSQNKTIVGWDFASGDPDLERIGEWSVETQ
ncbi:Hypothetical protein R9X50_00335500 [Acrodontium crateriforme]|uniref:F-box domain-containing protein n=1 Tax=Acrodontium crateriforme TaxID=150365 RepID=A0AAQ3R9D0_9PEZI|nr:Hypothetical protein R9X50_00335500 [Acrodontium crateriforme]